MVSWSTSLLNEIWFKPKGPGGILNDDHEAKKAFNGEKFGRKLRGIREKNYREAV